MALGDYTTAQALKDIASLLDLLTSMGSLDDILPGHDELLDNVDWVIDLMDYLESRLNTLDVLDMDRYNYMKVQCESHKCSVLVMKSRCVT